MTGLPYLGKTYTKLALQGHPKYLKIELVKGLAYYKYCFHAIRGQFSELVCALKVGCVHWTIYIAIC